MKQTEYLARIREFLHDPEGKIWTDEELSDMLASAADTYCEDTGIFRGNFNFLVDASGVFQLPPAYLALVAAWNDNGTVITQTDADELSRRYGNYCTVEGRAEYVYEELDGIGFARLCPNPHRKQNITVYVPSPAYGTVVLPHYGIPLRTADYGIPLTIWHFNICGDAQYIRTEEAGRIRDYTALIYHVVHQAYTMDGDFRNAEKAALYLKLYKRRVARIGQFKAAARRVDRGGTFY